MDGRPRAAAAPPRDRPVDPAWPRLYPDRPPSPLDRERPLESGRTDGLGRWIDGAHRGGQLAPEAAERYRDARWIGGVLRRGNTCALARVDLTKIPGPDRGPVLTLKIERVAWGWTNRLEAVIQSCRVAWPGTFDPNYEKLGHLAASLAGALAIHHPSPAIWWHGALCILEQIGRP